MLDAHGCEMRCSVMSDASQENQFIVARKEVRLLLYYQQCQMGAFLNPFSKAITDN